MYEVFDANLRKLDVLHLAYDRQEEIVLNGVSTIQFTLPKDDLKNRHCVPFAFIHDGNGQFYRILNDSVRVSDTGARTYTAEHAIATLVDNVMFGITVVGGTDYPTSEVLRYLLNRQSVKRWVLGRCDIEKQFEYGFESENLFNALMSVPNLFTEKYKFTYDMNTYPWRVNLIRLDEDAHPDFYIRSGKNLLSENADATFGDICTRLYLLGKGEGDNQTTIASANGGVPYLEAPQSVIAKYGIIEKVYVDRTIEASEILLARGEAIFPAFHEPKYARTFNVADLYEITGVEYDNAKIGDLTMMADDGYKAWITLIRRNLDVAGHMEIEMSSTTMDLAAQLADWADRQRINEVYSQGATQVYQNAIQANADSSTPCVLNFYIPQQMIIINRVLARITLESFRTDTRITRGGGGGAVTSSGGGGSAQTSGGSGTQQTTSGASTRETISISNDTTTASTTATTSSVTLMTDNYSGSTGSASAGTTGSAAPRTSQPNLTNSGSVTVSALGTSHSHPITHVHDVASHTHSGGTHSHTASHSHNISTHSHAVFAHAHGMAHAHDISHTHTVSLSSHSHSVNIPAHSHSVSLPEHTHQMEYGIYRTGNPQSAALLVNSAEVGSMEREREIDITSMLAGENGKIPRESWIRFGVRPNDLAHVSITVFVQGFIQSRGGGHY